MSQQILSSLALAVLVTAPRAAANILSCADVGCPITSGTTAATCTVVDRTFNAVGVVGIDSSVGSLKGLSWVKGVGAHNANSTERAFDQSFYLGTPGTFDFDGTGACALFFTQVSDRVKFGDGDVTRTQGTCHDAMTDSCVSALVDRAKKVDFQGLSGTAACDKLQKDFSDNLDSACASFAVGSRWTGIQAKGTCVPHLQTRTNSDKSALSGDGAPDPISSQQNKTSTCWPVLPKSDALTFIQSTNATVSSGSVLTTRDKPPLTILLGQL